VLSRHKTLIIAHVC